MVPFIEQRIQDFRPRDLVLLADGYARLPLQSCELFALAGGQEGWKSITIGIHRDITI